MSSKYYWANSSYDNSGDNKDFDANGKYTEIRSELKVTYGVWEDVNLLLSIPYKWTKFKNDYDVFKNDGVEDISLGVKYRIPIGKEDLPTLSTQITIKVPGGYDIEDTPALGDGNVEVEGRLLLGKKFNQKNEGDAKLQPTNKNDSILSLHSIGGEVGYRFRESGLAAKIPYFVEVNTRLYKQLYVRALLDGVTITESTNAPTEAAILNKEFEEYSKAMLLLRLGSFETDLPAAKNHFSVEAGYGYTFAGKNTAGGSELILNVTYSLRISK
ncbi:MAG: hypothetical protein HY754_00240 [Nitrospirae bacterium]|nr:hypothetical protein [Nitrospirota bacterium]